MLVLINVAEEVRKKFGDKCSKEIYSYIKDLIIEKPDERAINDLMLIKRIFSNETRASILLLLSQASLPVCALASIINKDQTLISHNLSILRKLNIIREKKVGKYRIYSLNKAKLREKIEHAFSALLR